MLRLYFLGVEPTLAEQRSDLRLILKNGTLIDGNGGKPLTGVDVTIADGKVERIIESQAASGGVPETEAVDCSGKFILPGLIDSHVHLAFEPYSDHESVIRQMLTDSDQMLALREMRHAQQCLLAGITTVRDCGGKGFGTLAVRDATAAGMLPGPRIMASGMPITTTFGHLYFCGLEVDGIDQVRVAVRRLAKSGADFIKVMATGGMMTASPNPGTPRYTQAELDALCEEARMLDKRVAAHVGSAEGIRRCVLAGVKTIEHCGWGNPDGSSGYDPKLVEVMAAKEVFVGATMPGLTRNLLRPGGQLADSERQRRLEELYRGWQSFRTMKAAGVPFTLSSDAGVRDTPFDEIHLSLKLYSLMMDASPLETISAITQEGARALGIERACGTIEPGKMADILVLDADPLQDLDNVRRVALVIREGKPVVLQGRLLL